MSDYEYDTGATRLVISEGLNIRDDKKLAIVSAEHLEGANIAVAVQVEDAPAVALAILEAAGIADDSEMFAASAVWNLRRVEANRAEKAEREAEDAKAKAYRDALFPGAVKWEHLDEEIRETHRTRYRAARKFFEGS